MQGQILSARYEILDPLGQGGFSNTYLAQDLHNGSRCVVKQLALVSNEPNFVREATRLFEKEAETLLKLNGNPQIPQIIDYFEEENQLYLIQELIEGQPLNNQLHPHQPWPETQVIGLLKDCLGILKSIHQQGVIHRDIKPDNLIVRKEDSRYVLIDFGSVKEFNPQQSQIISHTITVGTRGYMPPEQIQGRPRKSSDLYALGMVAIQALTGRQLMELGEAEEGTLIWQPYCTVSPFLAAILNKMVERDLQKRYSSATAILRDLEQKTAPSAIRQTQPIESESTVSSINSRLLETHASNTTHLPLKDMSKSSPSSHPLQSFVSSLRHSTGNLRQSPTFQTLSLALTIGLLATLGVYYVKIQREKGQTLKIEEMQHQLNTAYQERRYEDCLTQAKAPETLDLGMPEVTRLESIEKCGLASADVLAQDFKFGEAIGKLDEISQTFLSSTDKSPQVREAIKGIKDKIQNRADIYANELLEQAAQAYTQEGNLSEARSLISTIPPHYAIRQQALSLSQEWEAEYKQNSLILQDAEQALAYEEWERAIDYADSLSRDNLTDYWVSQAEKIKEKANKGIEKEIKEKEAQQNNTTSRPKTTSDYRDHSSEPPINNPPNSGSTPNGSQWLEVPEEFR